MRVFLSPIFNILRDGLHLDSVESDSLCSFLFPFIRFLWKVNLGTLKITFSAEEKEVLARKAP